jgi:uncharacterized lipoprotein YmbA
MKNVVNAARLILLAGLVALGGCFSLSRTETPQRHYVLGGDRLQESAPAPDDLAGLTIGVRRLRLAPYLEVPFLVVRQGPSRISYSEYDQWGEQLGGGINRVVAGQLATRSSIRAVDVAPWPGRQQYDFLVQLHVERFEGVAPEDTAAVEGDVHMRVTWEILRQRDGVILARGATDHREPGWRVGDYAGLVRALNAGLNVLTEDLASTLSSLGAPTGEGTLTVGADRVQRRLASQPIPENFAWTF